MVIAYCIGYLATFAPVPAGVGVPDSGLVGALILCGFPATASVGAVFVYHAISIWGAGIGRPHRAALDPASGTETGDRPGAETDRALGATSSSVVETALEPNERDDGIRRQWAVVVCGLRFVVGMVVGA